GGGGGGGGGGLGWGGERAGNEQSTRLARPRTRRAQLPRLRTPGLARARAQDSVSGELAPRAAGRSTRGGRRRRVAQADHQYTAALRQVAAGECLLSVLAVVARALGAHALRPLYPPPRPPP